MALTDRPTLAAAAGAACIASSATLVRLADVEPATAATFRCLYALPVLGLLLLREDRRYGSRPARDRWLAAAAGRLLRRRPRPVAPRHRRGRRRHRDGAGQPAGRGGRLPRLVAAGRAAEPAAGGGGAGGPGRGRAHLRRGRRRRLRRPPRSRRRLRARHVAGLRRRSCCCCGTAPGTCAARPARCSTRPPWRPWSAWRSARSRAASTWCRAGPRTAGWSSSR